MTMALSNSSVLLIFFAFLFLHAKTILSRPQPTTSGPVSGFTIDLIHRDSPKSPLYNPHETHTQRMRKAFRRTSSGAARLLQQNTVEAQVRSEIGQYLMKLSLGTPPVDVYGLLDTGSDLTWTQCQPCESCYKQTNPIFNPSASSTFSNIPCASKQCHLLDTGSCSPGTPNICNFTYGYASAQLTKGVLATETMTFGSSSGQPVSLPNIVFGCSRNTSAFNVDEMGLIGLGQGPISLITQIGSAFGSKKFSQCLLPFHTNPSIASKMRFGTGSEVSGNGVVSTPMASAPDPTVYFVTMEGISVGDKYVPFNSNPKAIKKANMFLDSGTPPMIIPKDFYARLESEVKGAIAMQPITNDPDLGTQLCYRGQSSAALNAPTLTVHFDGGAKVKLEPLSTFIPPKTGVYCFSFVTTDSEVGVYGNFPQINYLIGFDLDNRVVSFKPTDCTKEYS